MAFRPVLGAALVLAVVLAGCADPEPPASEPDDEPPADDGEPRLVNDLVGRPGGVDVEPSTDPTAPGTLAGVVYDPANGSPVDGATVFATCLRAELVPGFTQTAHTNATGGFAFADTASLADCLQLSYEVNALGFTLVLPLTSGPILDGTATFVHAAVVDTSSGTPA